MLVKNLFPPLPQDAETQLKQFEHALAKAAPLKPKHRKTLPYAVRDLSRYLTEERSDLKSDYMSEARIFTAYLHYFLPWNLYRLSRLFTGLQIELEDGNSVLDLGSGPLTVPLALWIARPDLRDKKLKIVCIDRAPKAMKIGLAIFRELAGKKGENWHIIIANGNFSQNIKDRANLVVSANALNELNWQGKNADSLASKLAQSFRKAVLPGGDLLLIETGSRLAGRLISMMRGELMDQGLFVQNPCPHDGECPMDGESRNQWCHFNFDTRGAAPGLVRLSKEAKLMKTSASLSLLHMKETKPKRTPVARVTSLPFDIPGGKGLYACSAEGLTLLRFPNDAFKPYSGQTVLLEMPEEPQRDEKSGAIIVDCKTMKTQTKK